MERAIEGDFEIEGTCEPGIRGDLVLNLEHARVVFHELMVTETAFNVFTNRTICRFAAYRRDIDIYREASRLVRGMPSAETPREPVELDALKKLLGGGTDGASVTFDTEGGFRATPSAN
jgi:hypothetical protein